MSEIIRFKILAADNPVQLEAEVEQYLSTGWEPQGGVCTSVVAREGMQPRDKFTIYQAMIKRSEAQVPV